MPRITLRSEGVKIAMQNPEKDIVEVLHGIVQNERLDHQATIARSLEVIYWYFTVKSVLAFCFGMNMIKTTFQIWKQGLSLLGILVEEVGKAAQLRLIHAVVPALQQASDLASAVTFQKDK
eukprot:jgi/Mesen1/7664/ME000400S06856